MLQTETQMKQKKKVSTSVWH